MKRFLIAAAAFTAMAGAAMAQPAWDPSKGDPPTDLPPESIITMDDLAEVEPAIVRAYKAGGVGKRALSVQEFDEVRHALAPEFRVYEPLRVSVDATAETLARLTRQQLQVLRGFDSNPRAIIEGVAGSGKTLLAMQRARSFAAKHQVISQELCAVLKRYNEDVLKALKEEPRNEIVISQFEFCTEMTATLFNEEEAELLRRRARPLTPRPERLL